MGVDDVEVLDIAGAEGVLLDAAILGDVFVGVGEVEVVEVSGFVIFQSAEDVWGGLDDGDGCGGDCGLESVCFSGEFRDGGSSSVSSN